MSETVVGWALWAAAQGFRVFPCEGKVPKFGGSWPEHSTSDPITIRSWGDFDSYAIDCVGSQLTVLDFDTYKSTDAQRHYDAYMFTYGHDPAWHVVTGGGGHHLYGRAVAGAAIHGRWGAGVDVKGGDRNGYVIGPGSLHSSGSQYRLFGLPEGRGVPVFSDRAQGEMRGEVPYTVDLSRAHISRPKTALDRLKKAGPGEKHNCLISAATALSRECRRDGLPIHAVYDNIWPRLCEAIKEAITEHQGNDVESWHAAETDTRAAIAFLYAQPDVNDWYDPAKYSTISAGKFDRFGIKSHKDFTDQALMTRAFCTDMAGKLIYVPGRGWLEWAAPVWREVGGVHPTSHWYAWLTPIKNDLTQLIYDGQMSNNERTKLLSVLDSLGSERFMNGVYKASQNLLLRDHTSLDADPYVLNTPAGVWDFRLGQMREHDPEDYCTRITSVSPAFGSTPLWDATFDTAVEGDQALRGYLETALGRSLLGVSMNRMHGCYGPSGSGKSTLLRAVHAIAGSYAGSLPDAVFTQARYHTGLLGQAAGARMVYVDEMPPEPLHATAIKRLMSGSSARVQREIGAKHILVRMDFNLWFSTNYTVEFADGVEGGVRRRALFPYFQGKQQPGAFGEKFSEHMVQVEGAAILGRLLTAAARELAPVEAVPESLTEATADVLGATEHQDVADFYATLPPAVGALMMAPTLDVYAAYTTWRQGQGMQYVTLPVPQRMFNSVFEQVAGGAVFVRKVRMGENRRLVHVFVRAGGF